MKKLNLSNKVSGKTVKNTVKSDKTPIKQHEKFNLILKKAVYDDKTEDFYVEVDDMKYPLIWDLNNIRFPVLYALPNNEKRDMWTGVQFDFKYIPEDKLKDVLKYWSPIRPNQEVYVLLHEGNAILTKQK